MIYMSNFRANFFGKTNIYVNVTEIPSVFHATIR